jgi:hypothetical protein
MEGRRALDGPSERLPTSSNVRLVRLSSETGSVSRRSGSRLVLDLSLEAISGSAIEATFRHAGAIRQDLRQGVETTALSRQK